MARELISENAPRSEARGRRPHPGSSFACIFVSSLHHLAVVAISQASIPC